MCSVHIWGPSSPWGYHLSEHKCTACATEAPKPLILSPACCIFNFSLNLWKTIETVFSLSGGARLALCHWSLSGTAKMLMIYMSSLRSRKEASNCCSLHGWAADVTWIQTLTSLKGCFRKGSHGRLWVMYLFNPLNLLLFFSSPKCCCWPQITQVSAQLNALWDQLKLLIRELNVHCQLRLQSFACCTRQALVSFSVAKEVCYSFYPGLVLKQRVWDLLFNFLPTDHLVFSNL